MAKFTQESKLKAAKRYLNELVSYRDLANQVGVDQSILRYWVMLVRHHGDQAFTFPYTNYPSAFKLRVIQFITEKNCSIREASAIFHIPDPCMVRRWVKKWERAGEDAFGSLEMRPSTMTSNHKDKKIKDNSSNQTMEDMKKELEYLRMENAYLKKLKGLSSGRTITNEIKAKVVFELRNEFPVTKMIKVAKLPKSTYYHITKKLDQPDPDRKWKRRINFIYHKHLGRLGYRRITDVLQSKGHDINKKKVLRIMRELDLKCIVRMKKYKSYKGKVGKVAPNILNRNFRADKPNQKWVTDVTEFKLFGQKLYLSPILDLFNGEIITYTLQSRPTFDLVETMLEQGLKHVNEGDELLIHSDQGWHYQMAQYRRTLKKHNITQSMSRKGNCYDNSVMENFFGIMKSEFLYLQEFDSIEHFKEELKEYMYYYNHLRIKSRLKRKSPVAYRVSTELAA
ncbi:IS3 family transposase [Rossellomorea vietnamensis]|uniref:IS3 family transposase n=1 Tax=Rossellomorea vietnamensis TaxID=218284 RepID=UPI001E4A5481|nr:IS3 family transposase [Rossellomorea vietnamensis]